MAVQGLCWRRMFPVRAATLGTVVALVVAMSVAMPLAAQSGATVGGPEDTLAVIPANGTLSNIEVAVEVSRGTPRELPVDRVVVARDDAFADALASGVLQADAPLLLVPRSGAIPTPVIEELTRLSPSEVDTRGRIGHR